MKTTSRRALALLLAFVMVFTLLPATAFADGAMDTQWLEDQYRDKPDGGTIDLGGGTVNLDRPCKFNGTKAITIVNGTITTNNPSLWTSDTTANPDVAPYNTMIYITGGGTITLGNGAVVDGKRTTQCISVKGANLWIDGGSVIYGAVSNVQIGRTHV